MNIEKIAQVFRENDVLRQTIKYLASRQRDPRNSETKANNLHWELANRGNKYSLDEVLEVLQILAELGCGSFRRRRPKEKSQLEWETSAREMAHSVMDQVGSFEQVVEEENEKDVEFETHFFPVRKGVQQELRLRADMSAAELENLAEFVKIIAASRKNA